MNRVFYFFRHGETNWNKEKRCQGHTNIELNENGLMQAMKLARDLKKLPIEIIYSSDLIRAAKTGSTVASELNVPILFDSRLREMSYGEAEGMLFHDAIEKFGNDLWLELQSFKKVNDDVGFPGGETRKIARTRLENFLNEILMTTDHKTIGISTHGGALRNLFHHYLPEDHEILPIPNCVTYKLEYDYLQNEIIVDNRPFIF
jgi:probable phosphoglycerate mutase